MRNIAPAIAAVLVLTCVRASSEPAPGSLNVHWNEGDRDCARTSQAPLQVHAYESRTFIIRQNLCVSFEGNFLYLLIGDERALLIDSGAIADAATMPLAKTVNDLLPGADGSKLPLTIVHTHRHSDHYDGDALFVPSSSVRIAPVEEDKMRDFFGFKQWPNEVARLELGHRAVDVIPTPGHTEDHVSFYDHHTALLFSGDFLLPGRLTLEEAKADDASAERVIAFLNSHPVTHILGSHIELDAAGQPYDDGSQYHPNEHPLQLDKDVLLQLPRALQDFNGFYARHPDFILTNPRRNLIAAAGAAIAVLALLVWSAVKVLRNRRKVRPQ